MTCKLIFVGIEFPYKDFSAFFLKGCSVEDWILCNEKFLNSVGSKGSSGRNTFSCAAEQSDLSYSHYLNKIPKF